VCLCIFKSKNDDPQQVATTSVCWIRLLFYRQLDHTTMTYPFGGVFRLYCLFYLCATVSAFLKNSGTTIATTTNACTKEASIIHHVPCSDHYASFGITHTITRNRSSSLYGIHEMDMNGSDPMDDEEDDDDDDSASKLLPYRNRSLGWTNRYRKLNPYEQCRQRVLNFGHRSKQDWDEAMESGQLGSYVPSHPDEMYAPEWVSWEEWLGVMRSYEETRNLAVHVLRLKSLDDYIIFVRSNPKRGEGLRIPVRPDLFYKAEWTSEQEFFKQDNWTTG
jgi:hypothetical protein